MSRPARLIEGFDYVACRAVAFTARQWQDRTQHMHRHTYEGETFYVTDTIDATLGHKRLAYEAYALIPERRTNDTNEGE